MLRFRVHLLGNLTVFTSLGQALPIPRSCQSILGYLITHRRRRISRVELAETLWPDHDGDHARRCLSTALWRIKKVTPPDQPLLSIHGTDQISFNWETPVWIDSIAMELRIQSWLRLNPDTLGIEALHRLQRGVRLYQGDYLIGIDDEWAWLERQRLRNMYFDGLYQLMSVHAAMSNWNSVLQWGRLLSQAEPLREDVHRMLMRAYAFTGNRAKSITQYHLCASILGKELGVDPMPETRSLYDELRHSHAQSTAASQTEPVQTHVDQHIERTQHPLASSIHQRGHTIEPLKHAGVPHTRE